MANFIFEIGFEEFPPSFIGPVSNQIKESLEKELKANRLEFSDCSVFSTCSRIAVTFKGLPQKQADLKEKVTGAPKKIAIDAEGNLSKAGEAFLRKNNITDYFFEDSPKGEVIAGVKEETGKELFEILIPAVKTALSSINFKKSMRWGEGKLLFARPIRWIFLSINGKAVKHSYEGIEFALTSTGHRFLSNGPLEVDSENYLEVLRGHNVIADRDERRKMISTLVTQNAEMNELETSLDKHLLEEVTDMLEYPHAIVGVVPSKYSDLPPELIEKVLRKDQRYFALKEKNTGVVKKFVSILNNIPRDDSVVIRGNEKVVSARLADAAFYYLEDLSNDFLTMGEKLNGVLFQKDLGTYGDKISRITKIALFIAQSYFNADSEKCEKIKTAAQLIKNDLVSGVVFEFPDLQGIMGKYYATNSGYDNEISSAVYEHYLPISADDMLPQTFTGKILSLADKIDTIVGGFMAGMKPTGSKDKFAIRRNALTFLTIACNGFEKNINLSEIIEFCSSLVLEHNDKLKDQTKEIKEFMTGRYQAVLHQDTPVVQAATGAGSDQPLTVRKRAQTIEKLLEDKEIAELAQLYKRGRNILKKQSNIQGAVDPALFEQNEEKALFESTEKVYEEIVSLTDNLDIALKIITLKPVLDSFFDSVFVMSEDEKVRINRLKLIERVTDLVTQNIGDISYLNI